jgi:hypothetical protein
VWHRHRGPQPARFWRDGVEALLPVQKRPSRGCQHRQERRCHTRAVIPRFNPSAGDSPPNDECVVGAGIVSHSAASRKQQYMWTAAAGVPGPGRFCPGWGGGALGCVFHPSGQSSQKKRFRRLVQALGSPTRAVFARRGELCGTGTGVPSPPGFGGMGWRHSCLCKSVLLEDASTGRSAGATQAWLCRVLTARR